MNIYEWCIAVLKGRKNNMRITELYNLCTKHYRERVFDSENELLTALEPFNMFFCLEIFRYDYVTFEDDVQKDSLILELAKDVLRSHSNRYTLSVLCRIMNESDKIDTILDEASLKNLLSSRNCFKIEGRLINLIKLSAKGEEYDIEPIILRRPVKSEEKEQRETELRLKKKLVKEKNRLSRKEKREEEREFRRKLKQKKTERKEEGRIEKIKKLITYYHITDETSLEQMWVNKLIRKVEYIKCADWRLYTVGQVYAWVKSRNLPDRMDYYRKENVQRLLKIASFHDPELARLIPNVNFSGIRKANRGIKLSQSKSETPNDTIDVKMGDAIRWNYTKDEGIVIGFDSTDEKQEIILRKYDGTKLYFENDPKLFIILDGKERDNVINQRKEYVESIRELKQKALNKLSKESDVTSHIIVSKDKVGTKHTKSAIENQDSSISSEIEVEHVFLDSHGKIVNSIVTSSVVLEEVDIKKNGYEETFE